MGSYTRLSLIGSLAGLVAILAALASSALADESAPERGHIDPVLKTRLLAEAPAAWERTREAHRHVECVGRSVSNSFDKGRLYLRDVTDWRIKVNGRSVIVEMAERALPFGDGPSDEPGFVNRLSPLRIEGHNQQYAFLFKRKDERSPCVVRSVDVFEITKGPPPRRRVEKCYLDSYQIFLNDNTEIGMVPLVELVRDPGFTLISLAAVRASDRDCVNVAFSYDPRRSIAEGGSALRNGWFVVDPQFDWAIRSFGADLHADNVYHIENDIEYPATSRAGQGVPTIRAISTRLKTDYGYSGTTRIEMLEVTYRDVPADEFRLAHYGLPEPIERIAKTRPPAIEMSWQLEPLEHAEAGKPTKFSFVISNRSASPLKLLGFFSHCGTAGCVYLEPEVEFPIEVPPLGQRTFSAEFTPRAAGKFEDRLEFYTDAPGQLIVSEMFTGEAR